MAFATIAIVPAFAAGVADASLAPIELTVPSAKYRDPGFILYQTGPAIAVAPKGRIWVAIMTGGRDECNLNYVDLLTSGDGGRTWSEPKLALDIDGPLRTFDPAMWTDPEGRVWLFWCQCYDFWDGRGGLWASVCENPDDENAAWSKPRRLCDGVMKDKPLVLANGDRWLFVEQWQDDTQPHVWKALSKLPKLPEWYHTDTPHVGANVYCSKDRGRTWNWLSTVPVPRDIQTCDEHMAVEQRDGTFRMLLRVKTGMAESTSRDGGRTWTTAAPGSVKNPAGRFFFGRLRSGNILLVKNGPVDTQTDRRDLMAFLSEDDGRTFPYRLELDMRRGVAYPDVSERPDGLIHCVHDYNRRAPGGGIILDVFTEADIKAGKIVSPQGRLHTIVRQNAKPAIRIAHIADPQIGFVTRRFPERSEACYGANYTADLQRVEAMIPLVNAARPDLVVIAGDLVQWSKDLEAEWPRLMKKFTAPVLVVPGNHDLGQKGALSTVHREHLERFVRVFGAAWGTRVVNGWRVIGVNSSFWQKLDGTAEVASAKDRHAAWLEGELAAAKANGEEPVIVSHIPPYVKSVDEPDSNHCIAQIIRRPLLDKAIGAGARFWLCGHEHVRSVQRYSTLTILTGEAVCANLDRSPAGFNILSIPADGPDYEWKKIRIR